MICNICEIGILHLEEETVPLYGYQVPLEYYKCDMCGSELGDHEITTKNIESCKRVMGEENYENMVLDHKLKASKGEK